MDPVSCSPLVDQVRRSPNSGRVATAQGKQGIWFLLSPDRENTGNFVLTQGKIWQHRENIWTVIINIKKYVYFFKIQKFFASLCSA